MSDLLILKALNARTLYRALGCMLLVLSLAPHGHAQDKYGLWGPGTMLEYQSEYHWLDSQRLRFHFYAYRSCDLGGDWKGSGQFPDTCYLSIFHNSKRVVRNIITLRDSNISHPNKRCNPNISECFGYTGAIGSEHDYSIYRYTGEIDFSAPGIKDTLDRLNACEIDIVFKGRYVNQYGYNMEYALGGGKDSQYCYFSINRCYPWKKGDRSPKPRLFHVPNRINWVEPGTQQMDFGFEKQEGDSLAYAWSLPRKYAFKDSLFRFRSPYSLNYYADGYCPGGPPCIARPASVPPRGFYLSPQTGITMRYETRKISVYPYPYPPVLAVETRRFRKNSSGQFVHIATQARVQSSRVPFYYSLHKIDSNSNRSVYTDSLRYYYYPCENQPLNLRFMLLDSNARNQTLADTIEYRLYNELPASRFSDTALSPNALQCKLQWTPPIGSPAGNPYVLNLYATEKRCIPSSREMFRSAEFNVIPQPRFQTSVSTTLCGVLRFSAEVEKPAAHSLKWRIFNQDTVLWVSLKKADSVRIPYPDKWMVELQVKNLQYGCSKTQLDSFVVLHAAIAGSVRSASDSVCRGDSLRLWPELKNGLWPFQFQWSSQGLPLSADSVLLIRAEDINHIALRVTDSRNCLSADSFRLQAHQTPAFSPLPDTTLCRLSDLHIRLQTHDSNSVRWNDSLSTLKNRTLSRAGIYIIEYQNQYKCKSKDSFILTKTPAIIDSSRNRLLACKGDSIRIRLFPNPAFTNHRYRWYADSVLQSAASGPVFAHKALQKQNIVAEVSADFGSLQCSEKDSFISDVFPQENMRIDALPQAQCLQGNRVNLDVRGQTAGAVAYNVRWGDGATDSAAAPMLHSYTQSGIYPIDVLAYDRYNCPYPLSDTVHILPSPIVSARLKDSIQCAQGNVFTMEIQSGNDVQHTVYWSSSDSSTLSKSGSVSHTYSGTVNSTQTRMVRLISSLNNGCKDSTLHTLTLLPLPSVRLSAASLCLGDSCIISAQSITRHAAATLYQWSLDGKLISSTDSVIRYVFPRAGLFSIGLKTSDGTCSDSARTQVTIFIRPKIDFDYNRLGADQGGIQMYLSGKGGPAEKWYWLFHDGSRAEGMNTQKTYPDTGIYRVRLTGVSAERCADSTEKDIRVLRQIEFYFPNAFGPERNHANRGFGLSSTQFGLVRSYEIRVYNRWGEMVFVSTDVNKLWTGENAFQGVYIYKALIYDLYNVLHEVKGVVELLE